MIRTGQHTGDDVCHVQQKKGTVRVWQVAGQVFEHWFQFVLIQTCQSNTKSFSPSQFLQQTVHYQLVAATLLLIMHTTQDLHGCSWSTTSANSLETLPAEHSCIWISLGNSRKASVSASWKQAPRTRPRRSQNCKLHRSTALQFLCLLWIKVLGYARSRSIKVHIASLLLT